MNEPNMILIWPDCSNCEGKGKVTVETYIHGYCDIEVECSRCSGEGWIEVEVCEACRQDENGCKCLDRGELKEVA